MTRMFSRVLLVLVAVLTAALFSGASAVGASATEFSGQATVVSGMVLGQPVSLADTGPLAPTGGARHACVFSYPNGKDCVLNVPLSGDPANGALQLELL